MGCILAVEQEEITTEEEFAFASPQQIDQRISEAARLHSKDPATAQTWATAALRDAERLGYEPGRANALRVRGMTHGIMGDVDAALTDFQEGLRLARALGDTGLEAACQHGMGMAYQHRGEYALALEALHRAVQIRRERAAVETGEEATKERGLPLSLNSLGALYGMLGNFTEAAACFTESLVIAERRNDRRNQQHILCNIALIHVECGEPEESLSFFEQSIRLSREDDEPLSLVNTLGNYANTLRKLGRLDEAWSAAVEAVQVARAVGNAPGEMTSLLNQGRVQCAQGDLEAAMDTFKAASKVAPTHHYLIPTLLQEMGNVYRRTGQSELARRRFEEALEWARSAGQKQEVSHIHLSLCKLLAEMGDHAAALRHHIAYHDTDRELQRQSAQNLMVAQLARREVEQAQREAEIHRLQNIELAERNRQKSQLLARLQVRANDLAKQAIEDPLTGLYNRRYLTDFLAREIERVQSAGLPLTVAVADLDDFKQVNDRFSHRIGDEVLKATAELFSRNIGPHHVVARYGGEEFVVVFPEATVADSEAIVERIRAAVAAYHWHAIHPNLAVTVSVGLSDAQTDAQTLLERADEQLYAAKLGGKNCVR